MSRTRESPGIAGASKLWVFVFVSSSIRLVLSPQTAGQPHSLQYISHFVHRVSAYMQSLFGPADELPNASLSSGAGKKGEGEL